MKFIFKRVSKKAISCILALAVVLCSISAVFSVFAEDSAVVTVTFTLDAGTNGGTVGGDATKEVQVAENTEYTCDLEVTAPDGQQFIGWSKDSGDYVGELTFIPENGTTYYAIFGEVIYVGGDVTDETAQKGSAANPYTFFGYNKDTFPASPFTTTATNCVVVLDGAVTLSSISSWTRNANKRLYITGLDPTTGTQYDTEVSISSFAISASAQASGIFGKGFVIDNCYITAYSGGFFVRSNASNFVIGKNVTCADDVQNLIAEYKTMKSVAPNMLYIIPYFWKIDLTEEFVEAFGEDANKLIHIREYLRDDAFEDYDIIPTEKDLYYINEKNLTPYCFMATQPTDNSYDCHMSQLGYKILADLIYKQGVELGYWK